MTDNYGIPPQAIHFRQSGIQNKNIDMVPTLRDQFAMAALTGLLAADDTEGFTSVAAIVTTAYQIADEMLDQRQSQFK